MEEPDLRLDAPQLKVEEVRLELASVLKLEVKGLEAGLLLEANLQGVVSVLEELVSVIGENPEVLRGLLETLRRSLETVEEVVEETATDSDRRTIRRTVDEEDDVVRSELDEDGRVMGERGEVEATGAAERRAGELNVDIGAVEGTGKEGRVLVRDVERVAGRE